MENVGLPGRYARVTRLIKRALQNRQLHPELLLAECSSCGAAVLGPQPPERCPTCGWMLMLFGAGGDDEAPRKTPPRSRSTAHRFTCPGGATLPGLSSNHGPSTLQPRTMEGSRRGTAGEPFPLSARSGAAGSEQKNPTAGPGVTRARNSPRGNSGAPFPGPEEATSRRPARRG